MNPFRSLRNNAKWLEGFLFSKADFFSEVKYVRGRKSIKDEEHEFLFASKIWKDWIERGRFCTNWK
jgi:hypothetical protein